MSASYFEIRFEQAVINALKRHGGLTRDEAQVAVREGMIAGIETFAWWKDGVQYVGTTGTTLRDALIELDKTARRVGEARQD